MNREKLKKILTEYFSEHTVQSILQGARTPSYKNAKMLYEKHNIPMHIWGKGIKSYLQDNSTKTQTKKAG